MLPFFPNPKNISLNEFHTLRQKVLNILEYPHAISAVSDVLIYEKKAIDNAALDNRKQILSELNQALSEGPGVFVVKNLYPDLILIDKSSALFEDIMREEEKTKTQADHFSKAGNNGRIWNSFQKMAEKDPQLFSLYFANPTLALLCEAWLGPAWQMTAQVNQVRPGGQAQQPHRDYHLGFQQAEFSQLFPLSVHYFSQYLTLQGAIAHSDMPVETGPTQLLPWSHHYLLGYLSYQQPEFIDYFQKNFIQLPLQKGDGLFFNPALFHAAGANTSKSSIRTANLLQVSSAFGVPMEAVDTPRILQLIYPCLQEQFLSDAEKKALISVAAKGYSFPTNLDTDPPLGGLVPQTQQQLTTEALEKQWSLCEFTHALSTLEDRRKA